MSRGRVVGECLVGLATGSQTGLMGKLHNIMLDGASRQLCDHFPTRLKRRNRILIRSSGVLI